MTAIAAEPITSTYIHNEHLSYVLALVVLAAGVAAAGITVLIERHHENPHRWSLLRRLTTIGALAAVLAVYALLAFQPQTIRSNQAEAALHVTEPDWQVTEQDLGDRFDASPLTWLRIEQATSLLTFVRQKQAPYEIDFIGSQGQLYHCNGTVTNVSWRGADFRSNCLTSTTGPKFEPTLLKGNRQPAVPEGWQLDSAMARGKFNVVDDQGNRRTGCENRPWRSTDKQVLICEGRVVGKAAAPVVPVARDAS